MGDPGTALRFAEKGLKIKMKIGRPGWLSINHWGLSLVHFDLGNLNEARVHAEQALNLAQTKHERYFEGESWLQLGRTLGKMEASQMDKAEEYILRGMKILDDLETRPAYAVGRLNLGGLYVDAGRKEKALENLRRSEELFSRMGMDYWLTRARNVLERT